MAGFRGVRVVSTDPLIIETLWQQLPAGCRAELPPGGPTYLQGQGAWHNLAIGMQAEQPVKLPSPRTKLMTSKWNLSYIAGPTIEVLSNQLTIAQEEGAIPYAADDERIRLLLKRLPSV
jgi:hypothetical protein